jgi:hypothetical protein
LLENLYESAGAGGRLEGARIATVCGEATLKTSFQMNPAIERVTAFDPGNQWVNVIIEPPQGPQGSCCNSAKLALAQ